MTKNIVTENQRFSIGGTDLSVPSTKEQLMDNWYAYIDNDYSEPNTRLYCKLEDCPKKGIYKD